MSAITTDPKEHLKVSISQLHYSQQTDTEVQEVTKLELQALNGFLKQSDGRDKLTAAVQVPRFA